MKETIKRFKQNSMFFAVALCVIIFFVVISILIKNNYNEVNEISELPDKNGDTISSLVINEIQSSNNGTYVDSNGKSYDWIELYNGSSKDKNLDNYSLSDTNNEIKWGFPNGTIIKSKSYLIVFLSGTNENGLYANFKLKSSGGENLILRNGSKKTVDAIETVSTSKGEAMARMEDGSFVVVSTPTPGYENTKKGYQSFISNIKETEQKKLSITEILPNNQGHFKNSHGEFSGYVEITNISNGVVSLKGYSLSNDLSSIYKWSLPEISLAPNEVLLVYTSNKNIYDEEYHANFKLNNRDGVVILTYNSLIEEKVEYNGVANGLAYIKQENNFMTSNMISPGYLNTPAGIREYENKYLTKNENLIINEAMNLNYSLLAQNGGNYYDWIELYNNTKKDIQLNDYYLTTSMDNPKMYKLPDITLKPHEFYILIASGDSNLSNNTYEHANFKLSDNEGVYLYKNNKIIDSMFLSNIPTGYSMGRDKKSGILYYETPSPGKLNGSGMMQISYTPSFSVEAGVYNNVENVTVEIKGENVRYTTDGSTPTSNSKIYSNPLVLTGTTILKAISTQSEKKNSEVITASYIINENHSLPVMSVSLNPSDFNSIQANAWVVDYEKPAYTEFFESNGNFSIPAGLKLFGGSARGQSKKSFSINFRKEYGEGSLNYQVFDNRDFSIYDSLVLRTGSQDEQAAIIRDIWGTSVVDGKINVDVQAYKSIILYINGNYRGIYFLREKVNQDFISSHYNVNNSNTDIIRIDGDVKVGSRTKYNELINYISSHNMANDEYYNHVSSLIDIDSMIDFWVAEAYGTNNDIINCRFFSNPDIDNGKWKFIYYDLDYAFYNYRHNYFAFSTSASGMGAKAVSTFMLRNMMKNDNFKKRYVERIAYQLKEVWNIERTLKIYDNIIKELTPEMQRNFNRWGGTMNRWNSELAELKTYIEQRNKYMISQTKSYFRLSNEEMNKLFGE